MIDVREAHYRVLALKRTDSTSVNELNRYILLRTLYRLRSALDPGLRPLTQQQIDTVLGTIQTKCVALGLDTDLMTKIHQCNSSQQKIDVIDRLIAKCWRKFRLQKIMVRVATISITVLIGAVLMKLF